MPGMTRFLINVSARSACCQTVAGSPASGPRASKNGTRSSSTLPSPVAMRYCASTTQRPEDDVAVRIAGPDVALAVEEHEPLRPVAIGILLPHHPQQQIADRLEATEREQQLHRSLADVARAPAAAGVLLEAARRQVMHERIVREPRHDVRDAGKRFLSALAAGTVMDSRGTMRSARSRANRRGQALGQSGDRECAGPRRAPAR